MDKYNQYRDKVSNCDISKIFSEKINNLYGNSIPDEIDNRAREELTAITSNHFDVMYAVAKSIVEEATKQGFAVSSRGCIGSSFVAFLLGITGINPLKPHYLCPSCKQIEFVPDVLCGYDLPKKSCPECSAAMKGDGHNIPFASFAGLYGEKEPDVDLNVAPGFKSQVFNVLQRFFSESIVIREGIKNRIGEFEIHPSGYYIIPNQLITSVPTAQVQDIEGTYITVTATAQESNELRDNYPIIDLFGNDSIGVLSRLSAQTGICLCDIPMNDPIVMEMFANSDTDYLPEFGILPIKLMLEICRPSCFSDLVKISGLFHGTDVWANNAAKLIETGKASLQQILASREDVYQYLIDSGMDHAEAYQIMDITRRGRAGRDLSRSVFEGYEMPPWFFDSICKIKYMFPKAHITSYVKTDVQLAWFKAHYSELFYNAMTL